MPTDEQIEAAAMAACDAANRYDGTWKVLDAGERKTWRLAARAALEAAERIANAELRNRKEARDAD